MEILIILPLIGAFFGIIALICYIGIFILSIREQRHKILVEKYLKKELNLNKSNQK